MHFADTLLETCLRKNSRLVVGLDPHWNMIPETFKGDSKDTGDVITDYLIRCIEVCAPHAAAFKPQIAFFEQFGPTGMIALAKVLDALRAHEAITIMDAKRNDIGSTAAAYARAFFGDDEHPAGFPSDALTINVYLGEDGVRPFMRQDRGLFALVKTSNPSSGDFQDMTLTGDITLADRVADQLTIWNRETLGEHGYGNLGAVVGATYPEHMQRLRTRLPQSILLVPGYGAQGGSLDAVRAAFDDQGLGAVINSARGVLFPKDLAERGFDAVRDAAIRAKDEINELAK